MLRVNFRSVFDLAWKREKMGENTHTHTYIYIYIFIATTSGSVSKTGNGEECRDLIEPSRNSVNKQEYLTPISGIETQNENERYEQQKNFREDSKQGHGSDNDEMSVSSRSQDQEDGITSNRLQETTTTHPIHLNSGDLFSKDVSKGGEESGAPPAQAQVQGGHTSRFFASLFGAGEKSASRVEASPNAQNNIQVR